MSADLAGAARLHRAVRLAQVQLLVNWPFYWWPALQHAIQLTAEGRIGEVFQVNYRAAHAGPREAGCSPYFFEWLYDPDLNGAGALIDYCSYGAALTCLLLGLPSRVSAISGRLRKDDLLAEDNAVLVMQHARAISTSTASWTQIGHLTSYVPMIYGTDGTIVIQDGSLWLATREHADGIRIEVPEPPAYRQSSSAYFLHHIISGEPISGLCSSDNSFAAQHVLEAALISSGTQASVSLPLPAFHLHRPAQ
jgi:predicted dehydrogenase